MQIAGSETGVDFCQGVFKCLMGCLNCPLLQRICSSCPLNLPSLAFQLFLLRFLAVFKPYIDGHSGVLLQCLAAYWVCFVFSAELCWKWVGSRNTNRRRANTRPPEQTKVFLVLRPSNIYQSSWVRYLRAGSIVCQSKSKVVPQDPSPTCADPNWCCCLPPELGLGARPSPHSHSSWSLPGIHSACRSRLQLSLGVAGGSINTQPVRKKEECPILM